MRRIFLSVFICSFSLLSVAQIEKADRETAASASSPGKTSVPAPKVVAPKTGDDFIIEKLNPATSVKNQGSTGTCWSFSTTSLLESQLLKSGGSAADISELYTVRNMYIEKGRQYLLRQGKTQFGEGGLGHDVIRSVATYGAMPEEAYPFSADEARTVRHQKAIRGLKNYLDTLLAHQPVASDWQKGYEAILDKILGPVPQQFTYNGRSYTPKTYAAELLKFNADDYVNITSFTHHPFYSSFVLEVPDNFSNGAYYNIPLNEMTELVRSALKNGYTVLWDADVSNEGFMQKQGLALNVAVAPSEAKADLPEDKWDVKKRQELFENLSTQDDHLMHITGLEKSKGGKTFFVVKNSWGDVGPLNGYINVSESYFAINTVSLVVPKAAVSKTLLDKLKIK
ncbi:MAG: C1 family peptidase [Ferruginibacter sp.]